jgi:hypothetical protein
MLTSVSIENADQTQCETGRCECGYVANFLWQPCEDDREVGYYPPKQHGKCLQLVSSAKVPQ